MCRVILFVIAVAVFPAITLAGNNESACLNNEALITARKSIGQCWDNVLQVLVGLNRSEPIVCNNVTDYEIKMISYFNEANKTCPKFDWVMRSAVHFKMLNTTVQNIPELKKFYYANCTNRAEICDTCFKNFTTGVNVTNLSWWQRFNPIFQDISCAMSKKVEECIITSLNKECPDAVDYTQLIYKVGLENCSRLPGPQKGSSAGLTSTLSMVMITMPLVLVQCVVAGIQ